MSFSRNSLNGSVNTDPSKKWESLMSNIETAFRKIAHLTDEKKKLFFKMKSSQSEFRIQTEYDFETLNYHIRQVSNEITALERLVGTSNSPEMISRRFMIKDIRRRASYQTKIVRELYTDINTDLRRKRLTRMHALSQELDFDEKNNDPNEQVTIIDSQLKIMTEQQKRMEKITVDIILLEDMFLKLGEIVETQGKLVDHSAMNVENTQVELELAEQKLNEASEYKQSDLKKKLCIIGIVIVVLVVIAVIIGLVIGLKK